MTPITDWAALTETLARARESHRRPDHRARTLGGAVRGTVLQAHNGTLDKGERLETTPWIGTKEGGKTE